MDNPFVDFFGRNPNSPSPDTEDRTFTMLRGTLEAVDNVSNEDFYVIDFKRHEICYMSRNLLDFLAGHDIQSMVAKSPLDLLLTSSCVVSQFPMHPVIVGSPHCSAQFTTTSLPQKETV